MSEVKADDPYFCSDLVLTGSTSMSFSYFATPRYSFAERAKKDQKFPTPPSFPGFIEIHMLIDRWKNEEDKIM
jgi:hypothetical protein